MRDYVILPGCDDQNRGDQALVWETVRIAKDAGFVGTYTMMADKKKSSQSVEEGLEVFEGILLHPSRKYTKNQNTSYHFKLLMKWGLVAAFDLLYSFLLLVPFVREMLILCSNKRIKTAIRTIKNADAVFVKGGGFIHAHGGLTEVYKIYYFLYHIILALSYHKDIYIFPNSFGPFEGLGVKWMVKKVLSKCKMVACRESESQKMLLNDCGILSTVYPDLAFYLQKQDSNRVRELLEKENILVGEKKYVALTMRPYRFPENKEPLLLYNNYKKALVQFVKWLIENDFTPVFIEHTLSETDHEKDICCIRDVMGELVGLPCSLLANSDFTSREMKQIYSQFDYIVGTRFHSMIFSFSENVPGIAITYGGNKGNGIMKDMDLEEFSIPIANISFDDLKLKFLKLIENNKEVKIKLKNYLQLTAKRRNDFIQDIKNNGE